jgi:hypothetical protein
LEIPAGFSGTSNAMKWVSEQYFRGVGLSLALASSLLLVRPVCAAATLDNPVTLENGYRQMYNLDFQSAHRTFETWKQLHPEDPLGPVSNAAAYLFAEFDRLHVLESELFVNNEKFEKRQRLMPDPAIRRAFESELQRSEQMANQVLSRSPQAVNAQFAKMLANGLRGDYLALIDKRNLAALNFMKGSRSLAEELLAQDPSFYDAYLAIGAENYLLGSSSAPVRWFLRLGGAQTDKQDGIAKLRLTAEKGRYLAPFARLLLAVAALRDQNREQARTLLAGLAQEFPGNPLYKKELARLQP